MLKYDNRNVKYRELGRDMKKVVNKIRETRARKSRARDGSLKLKEVSTRKHSRLSEKEHLRKAYLHSAPETLSRRVLWRMNPKRIMSYWLSPRGKKMFLRLCMGGVVAVMLSFVGVYAYFKSELPDPEEVNSRVLAQNTRFYDRTGKTLLFELSGDQNRKIVKFDEMSKHIKDATISIEDQDFYEHGGFSVRGITRAFFNNLKGGGGTQGGSTITQQYVKNSFLTKERSYVRKIKELILSVELERLYSKDQILALYLNEIPYGGTIYGVESASKNYFDKHASELTVDEAAFLAAIPQQPGAYNPCDPSRFQKEAFLRRQDRVIDNMLELKKIKSDEASEAKKQDTLSRVNCVINPYKDAIAPHFVDEVQKQLLDSYGQSLVRQGGLEVITTLDLPTQKVAEETVAEHVGLVEGMGGDDLALVAGDQRTGQILAMVGSRDYNYPGFGAVNVATRPRQPGSSFKPYAYAELFETGKWGPGSTLYDLKTDFGGNYVPKNFNDGQFSGAISIRNALDKSLNIPAVKALYIAGKDNVINQAQSQGITTLKDREKYGLALVLGAGEVKLADMVTGYGAFAAGGIHNPQTYVLKVTNSRGEVLQEFKENQGRRVLDEQVAFLISDILSDRKARFGALNRTVPTAAIKTGTTSDVKDFWTMGYSDYITTGVWVGNHDNQRMARNASSLSITPIWIDFMNTIHKNNSWPDRQFKRPEGLKQVTLDLDTGKLANETTSRRTTDWFPSYYQPQSVKSREKIVIDTVTGKLATDCTPENTRKEVVLNGIDAEIPSSDPFYKNWLKPIQAWAAGIGRFAGGGGGQTDPNANATAKDDLHQCSDTKPTVSSVTANSLGGGTYNLAATVSQGTHALESVEFFVNGDSKGIVGASGGGTYSIQVSLSPGSYTITARVTDVAKYQDQADSTTSVAGGSFQLLSPPSGNISPGNVVVSWSSHPSATSYSLTWSCSGGGPSGSINLAGTSYSIGLVSSGKNCSWSVSAKNGGTTIQTLNRNFST